MNGKKEYHYFVSYVCSNFNSFSFGYAEVARNKEITEFSDIAGIADEIKKIQTQADLTVTILNYVLLRSEGSGLVLA